MQLNETVRGGLNVEILHSSSAPTVELQLVKEGGQSPEARAGLHVLITCIKCFYERLQDPELA